LTAAATGAYVLAENYLYTVEAAQAFLDHLTPGGVLSIATGLWNPRAPRSAARMMNVARAALLARGVAEPERNMVVVHSQAFVAMVLVKGDPFTERELRTLRDESRRLDFLPLVLGDEGDPLWKTMAGSGTDRLAAAGDDPTINLWDLTAANPDANLISLTGHEAPITTLAFSPDGHWLASGSADSTARLWNLTAANPEDDFIHLNGHQAWVNSVAFSPDGHWLATASDDATIRLWDMTSDDPNDNTISLEGHAGPVNNIAFSPDSHWLASGSNDSTVRLWDMTADDPNDDVIALEGHESWVYAVAFSPDSRWLAAAGSGTVISFWDLTAENIDDNVQVLQGHQDWVETLAFGPDGRLASGSDDTTIRLWDLTSDDPAANVVVLESNQGWVYTIAFSPDGRWLASGGNNDLIRLWMTDLDAITQQTCQSIARNLTNRECQQYFPGEPYRQTCPAWPLGLGVEASVGN
jgi:WD40 repeat protein